VRLWAGPLGQEIGHFPGDNEWFAHPRLFPSPGVGMLAEASICPKHTQYAIYDADLRRRLVTLESWKKDTWAVSPDGKVVVTGGGPIRFWEFATGAELPSLPEAHRGPITAFAFSPDGKRLASAGADTSILVWDWEAHLDLRG